MRIFVDLDYLELSHVELVTLKISLIIPSFWNSSVAKYSRAGTEALMYDEQRYVGLRVNHGSGLTLALLKTVLLLH